MKNGRYSPAAAPIKFLSGEDMKNGKPADSLGIFFTWRTAILNSNLPPTTRHVLLTLSCHMNEAGSSCFPTTKTLARETRLSERSVCSHIEQATQVGWIKKSSTGTGRGWRRYEYQAEIPVKVLKEIQHLTKQRTETVSAALSERAEPLSKGAEPNDTNVLKEVQSSTSYNSSKNSPKTPGWLDHDLWSEFKKMRTKIKAPMTAHAEELALKELGKLREHGHNPDKVIEQSILNCWKGFFPLKESLSDSIGGAKVVLTPEQLRKHKEHIANVRAGNV